MSGYVNSTITSKTFFLIFTLIIITCLSSLLLFSKKNKEISIKISKVDIFIFLFFLWIIINRYFVQLNFGLSIRFIELCGLSVIYLFLRNLSFRSFIGLFLAIIISSIIQSVYGNLQLLGYYGSNHSGFKLTGSFFNPGPYAGFLTSVFPIALSFYFFKEKLLLIITSNKSSAFFKFIKYLFEYTPFLAMIGIFIIIPATQSRASWISIVITSFLLLEIRYQFVSKTFRRLNKIQKIFLFFGTGLIFLLFSIGIYHLKKGSSDGRLFIWKNSIQIIKDNPFFGVGFDRFKTHYMEYQANYFSNIGETSEALVADNTYYAFNEFIQFTVENGIIGFIILIILLITIFRITTLKNHRFILKTAQISLISISTFAFFSYPMEILPIKIILISLLSIVSKLDSNKKELFIKKTTSLKYSVFKVSAVVTGCCISFFGILYLKKIEKNYKIWEYALDIYQYGNYENAIEQFELSYSFFKNNGDFLMNYGKALSLENKNEKAIEILQRAKQHLNTTIIETTLGDAYKKNKQYEKAEKAYVKSYDMIPVRFYPLYLLAKLYEESGQREKAIETAKYVLEKKVKIPSTAIKEIQLEMKKIISSK
jgi:O-antigen ligase